VRLLLQTERPRKPFPGAVPLRSSRTEPLQSRNFWDSARWCASRLPSGGGYPDLHGLAPGWALKPLKADDDTDARPDRLDVRIPSRPLQAVVRHVDPLQRGECVNARANAHEHAA
jgi:hypothetical protein